MDRSDKKNKASEVKTFSVPYALAELKENITVSDKSHSQFSREEIINKAINLHLQGDIQEAIKYYKYCLNQKFDDHKVFSNYGGILKGLGKLKEAEFLLRKAIELKPDFADAYLNLGIILRAKRNLKEAESSINQAIEINPNFAEAHYNLGIILKDLGKLDQARESTIKALKLKPDSTEFKLNLENIEEKAVPRWHIPMMNDTQRNNAYFKAIKFAINENKNVLEIGTGSGLLSMIAIDAGAQKVVTCESNKTISEIAKKIISKNGYTDQIKVINKKSTELMIGNHLSKKADLLISEIFSSELVGEGIQTSILDAKKRLLKENGKMIPEAGEIKIALLQSHTAIEDQCFTNEINGYDFSDFNLITGKKFSVNLIASNISFLSDEIVALSFNFYSNEIKKKEIKIIQIPIIESGTCLGIITWNKVNLYQNIYLENKPGASKNSHWKNLIYTFKKPMKVKKGELIQIKASLLEDSVWFELIE